MSINCIIVDDDPMAVEIIQRHTEKIKSFVLLKTFNDAQDALQFIETNPVDLVFLDVNMPDLSGTELAVMINGAARIIFTTAYPEFAINGFEVNAVDYLLKPVTFEKFSKAVIKLNNFPDMRDKLHSGKAGSQNNESPKVIFVKSGTSLYKIDIESIKYLEKEGNYFKLVTADKSILIRLNFAKLSEMLPASQFIRIHKSYIINLMQIEKIEVDTVTVKNVCLPIGFSFRNDLNAAIEKFV